MARRADRSRRSPKAGRPPTESPAPPRVRRRRKRAETGLRKDTTLFQGEGPPRVQVAAVGPKHGPRLKKR